MLSCVKLEIIDAQVGSMPSSNSTIPLESFPTFGDLLKYLRRRARLTQRELCIAVGYSEAQVSRLEQNQRPPELSALTALFIPALYLEDEPLIVNRLMELAAQARGEKLPQSGIVSFSRSVRSEVRESVRIVEEGPLNNLPMQLTSFIGRAREIDALTKLLDPGRGIKNRDRLVTLTGSGGCGKTRLALEVARYLTKKYKDGVWLIELASISDPVHVPHTFITALGLPEPRDDSVTLALTKFLRTKHILLVTDNCEHVVSESAKLLQEILRSCPDVYVVATSREILNVPGEVRFRVPSLSVSNAADSQSESVQLFVDRAKTALPTFDLTDHNAPDVARICLRLDGIPLAIELAAARMTALSIQQIAARLDKSFQLLTGGLPHHRTLNAAIEWSYDLLSESERVLLHRLSVFAGGWTLDAAESVTSDSSFISAENVIDLLSQLVNKSLVVVDFQARGETHYHLLETVREFSRKQLNQSGEHGQIERQHFEFFLNLAEKAEAGFMTADHQSWLQRLDIEQDNLRVALDYGLSAKQYEATLRFAGTLFWFWQTLGYISEGRSHLERILTVSLKSFHPDQPGAIAAHAKALWCSGGLSWIQGDYAQASLQLEESIRLWRQPGQTNKLGLAISLREMGIVETYRGNLKPAFSALQESIHLMRVEGSRWNLALALYNQGLAYESKDDVATARANFEESLAFFRALDEPWGLSVALCGFGRIAGRQGDYGLAHSHLQEALSLSRILGDLWSSAAALYLQGEVCYLQKDAERAAGYFAESLKLNQTVGDKVMIGFTLHNLGRIANSAGDARRAAHLFGIAKPLRGDMTNTSSWSITDHVVFEQDITNVRAMLEEKPFELAWNMGQAMNVDEAIAYALGDGGGHVESDEKRLL